jgi:hypothetical protein
MNACRQTDALERRLAAGEPASTADLGHASGCEVCAATIAAAERLQADLPRTVATMTDEPIPSATELLATRERSVSWQRLRLVGGLATAAVVATAVVVAVAAGQLIGDGPRGPGEGGPSSPPVAGASVDGRVPDDMAGWVAQADASIWAHQDRPLPAPELRLVRLERCGDDALAFFADPGPSDADPLLFGIGNYRQEPFDAGFGGVATSVDDTEAANARAQQSRPCEVVVDTVLAHDAALAAYLAFLAGDDRVTDPQVLATKLLSDDVALAYVDETESGQPHQQVLVLRRDGDAWAVTGAQGGDYPVVGFSVGVTPLGVAKGMPDERWAAVGRTEDVRVVAVELDFAGFTHRFSVTDGAFVIVLPPDVGFEIPYRLLDADGQVLSEGTTQP